jgi:phosphoglycolate phosphatase-like HAD superfamily hydrolase
VTEEFLSSWCDGPTKRAIVDFVVGTCGTDGSAALPVEERVAVFDNDGTLWCEKPMPIQLDFILRRLGEMVAERPERAERQPWKAVAERDHGWFGAAMDEHYAGNDTNVRTLAGGILAAYDGISVEDFEESADRFLRTAQHPTFGRGYLQCAYVPMVELLTYLAANGFANYIASGGGRDFMRPISQDMYGIPRERVIGSSTTFAYTSDKRGGTITHKPEADYLDDGPEKPIRIYGAGSAGARCSRPGTPTATSQCSSSPTTPTSRHCGSSSCTTTPTANSTTPRAPNRRSNEPRPAGGPWSV